MQNKIDYDFSKYEKAIRSSVGVCIRANYYDEMTREFIKTHDNPVIVHMGCSLDTRYHRLGKVVTNKAQVYEMDLPKVMEMRKTLLPEPEKDVYFSASIFDTDWMDELAEKHKSASFIFVIEGVLMCFENTDVNKVLLNLVERFPCSTLVFDVINGWLCKNFHRHDTVKLTKTRFRFACDDDKEMKSWSPKLKLLIAKRFNEFDDWRRTGWFNYAVTNWVPTIRYASCMLCYKIVDYKIVKTIFKQLLITLVLQIKGQHDENTTNQHVFQKNGHLSAKVPLGIYCSGPGVNSLWYYRP